MKSSMTEYVKMGRWFVLRSSLPSEIEENIMKRIICWKHNRQTDEEGYCVECNGVPPDKPKAYSDSIKEASVVLSYAFADVKNDGMRQYIAESWEYKLKELIKEQGFDIV